MIKRQYIVDYEVWQNGKNTEWGTQTFYTQSWFPVNVSDMYKEFVKEAAEYSDCSTDQIRIVGVFKL
jgi:hypothetical protein